LGVWTAAIRPFTEVRRKVATGPGQSSSGRGLICWLIAKVSARVRTESRLLLVERINLAPRQSLSLIEADGQRLLVATSADGAPAFYALATPGRTRSSNRRKTAAAESGQ
jgi:hypothetical protein